MKTHRADEWILGSGCDDGARYLVHTAAPRFVCRVSGPDDVADRYLAGFTAELASGSVLHTWLWLDPPPEGSELRDLVAAAELALIRSSLKTAE
ncbi:MAG: hypothetical protein IT336_15115 [Thermomicrobiales bacterium]|nr:hypothetical protein [Thermomicrobiales bacterium]